MTILILIGRILFSAIFLMSFFGHFKPGTIAYAQQVGLPAASILVPASGTLAGLGALSVMLGFHARIGAALIALFLIPVTIKMHDFWNAKDPMMAQMHQAMFMKNVSMLGAALLIIAFGSGPLSLAA
jgi:putative oxidoreductase